MNKVIDTFDNVTADKMCPQLLEMVTQLQKENKELKEENKKLKQEVESHIKVVEFLLPKHYEIKKEQTEQKE
eukprot:COSAG02_NODE_8685_length_2479_cov_1.989496_4_plen_72_part_00